MNFRFFLLRKRVYFRDVVIVVPSTWKIENHYDDYNDVYYDGMLENSTWQIYDRADFCVENRDMYTIDTPFVVNYASGSFCEFHFANEVSFSLTKTHLSLSFGCIKY
jgi:hypothetical protein